MLKLINLSTYKCDMDRFHCNSSEIINLLKKHNMDGVELLNSLEWNKNIIPSSIVRGVHLKYYPTWLDFWNNNESELLRQFGSMKEVKNYYGGTTRECIIDYYRSEILQADKIGAEYVVFHVAHVQVEHAYTYDFTYSDEEIIDATAELINEIFKGLNTKIKLLFENLWLPGLTMLNKDMLLRLLEQVDYFNKGFMLDTAHLMNTNFTLTNEKDGIQYILDTVSNLGELKKFIKGIHLNCSLSGKYVKEQIKENHKCKIPFNEMKKNVLFHIMKIDMHKPFSDIDAKKLIDFINPQYVIYEFITKSFEELEEYIAIQNKALQLLP
ncbi:TIM barrel protein [Clostridium bowmanii]|uniref:TIM barrel protein n=1 Tax=Clostridium bowmanii TaxID=132925 RepID=UPI001C0E3A53|nr:TIM barrel protein [Clostridium bowmanii]MBU3189071.1 TIM barrel protein [Clostridium bowmanii]MCA1073827.1 TIM barrel protein [Clostridium bowmanii]